MARGNDWIDSASCVVERPDLPWTGEWFDWTLGQLAAMTRTCHACPVLRECLAFADRVQATCGFWAGSSRDARTVGHGAYLGPLVQDELPGLGGAA
ncbi:WhiB family transcriptional regulator [Intrasporangium calvum]|uniref:WhiB family transcriptional regulator n=1 Tax=Intrasporangium calvum TaxID=53358 RepID=UPI000DF5D015|nr:hypothetical protein DN585_00410 [Intrasporangium calvum]